MSNGYEVIFLNPVQAKGKGLAIPTAGLYSKSSKNFSVKFLSVINDPQDPVVLDNIISVKGKKIYVVSKRRDSDLIDALILNKHLVSKPRKMILDVVSDQLEELSKTQEVLEKEIDEMEDKILMGKGKTLIDKLIGAKKVLIKIRQVLKNYLKLTTIIVREDRALYNEAIALQEEIIHFDELIDTQQEILSNMIDASLSIASNKLNNVMKVLTIITTIAIPFTVLSSIYGMNIKLPFQDSEHAFFAVLIAILLVVSVMFLLFAKLGWLKPNELW
ncbi:MAG: CorA family divalent cation transporter [archaeon]